MYFSEFQLAENSNLEEQQKKKFSLAVMKELFEIPALEETRLWIKDTSGSNTYEQLARLDITIYKASIFSGQLFVIERKNEDGSWPRQVRSRRVCHTVTSYVYMVHKQMHMPHSLSMII